MYLRTVSLANHIFLKNIYCCHAAFSDISIFYSGKKKSNFFNRLFVFQARIIRPKKYGDTSGDQ